MYLEVRDERPTYSWHGPFHRRDHHRVHTPRHDPLIAVSVSATATREPVILTCETGITIVSLAILIAAGLAGVLELATSWALNCPCQISPRCAPRCLWADGVNFPVLARRDDVVIQPRTIDYFSSFE